MTRREMEDKPGGRAVPGPAVTAMDIRYPDRHRGVILARAGFATLGETYGSPASDWPVGDDRMAEVYQSSLPAHQGQMHVCHYQNGSPFSDRTAYYPAPSEARDAFEAGQDWRPLVDWLVETYPALDWLGELSARVEG